MRFRLILVKKTITIYIIHSVFLCRVLGTMFLRLVFIGNINAKSKLLLLQTRVAHSYTKRRPFLINGRWNRKYIKHTFSAANLTLTAVLPCTCIACRVLN